MYSVKGDGIVIYSDVSPTESRKAASPKLTIGDNSAGSLEITLPQEMPDMTYWSGAPRK